MLLPVRVRAVNRAPSSATGPPARPRSPGRCGAWVAHAGPWRGVALLRGDPGGAALARGARRNHGLRPLAKSCRAVAHVIEIHAHGVANERECSGPDGRMDRAWRAVAERGASQDPRGRAALPTIRASDSRSECRIITVRSIMICRNTNDLRQISIMGQICGISVHTEFICIVLIRNEIRDEAIFAVGRNPMPRHSRLVRGGDGVADAE